MKKPTKKIKGQADWNGFIGVDLDGTLANHPRGATYDPLQIGAPIPAMVRRVKKWLKEGRDVRIFTARVSLWFDGQLQDTNQTRLAIDAWCRKHIGQVLAVQCSKDSADVGMKELWDDRAVRVKRNTGKRAK